MDQEHSFALMSQRKYSQRATTSINLYSMLQLLKFDSLESRDKIFVPYPNNYRLRNNKIQQNHIVSLECFIFNDGCIDIMKFILLKRAAFLDRMITENVTHLDGSQRN